MIGLVLVTHGRLAAEFVTAMEHVVGPQTAFPGDRSVTFGDIRDGLENTILVGSDGCLEKAFIDTGGAAVNGVYASGPDLSSFTQNDFYANTFLPAYNAQFGGKPTAAYHAQAFDAMNILFKPAQPPTLTFDAASAASCPDARPSPPASYCPSTNTIAVDLPAMEKLGTPQGGDDMSAPSGDNTAYSVLMSRYMMSLQHQRGGLVLDNAEAGLRTACLTGVATTKLADGVSTPDGNTIALTAGDLDEAVAGLLTNGLAAGDVNGEPVPAGFSRIDAFRIGVLGDQDRCLKRFP